MAVGAARTVLVLALAASLAGALGLEDGPRLFWTVAIAALPLLWVVGGYHLWRRICPLAAVSRLGALLGRGGTRRVGPRVARHSFTIQFGLMFAALALRHVVANGTPGGLVALVGGLAAVAVLVGLVYTGKTWCNHVCPVGVVEKVYCEPVGAAVALGPRSSACSPCTGCVRDCPDIDLEQGYWKMVRIGRGSAAPGEEFVAASGPRMGSDSKVSGRGTGTGTGTGTGWGVGITYAWPGLVGAFYFYFWLRTGTWDFYFSGAWAYETGQAGRWLEPGLFFSDLVPVVVAAPLTLALGAAVSATLFAAVERAGLSRHHTMSIAAVVGFLCFYAFAGQPTIGRAPAWAARATDGLVVAAAALLFVRRWRRSDADYVEEKFARKLARGQDNRERAVRLEAYRDTVRELLADGVLSPDELGALARLRARLGIGDREHEAILRDASEPVEGQELAELDRLGQGCAASTALAGDRTSASLGLLAHLCRWRADARIARAGRAGSVVAEERAAQRFRAAAAAPLERPAAIAAIAALAAERDTAPLRAAAVFALGRAPDDPTARAALDRAVGDPDPLVREAAYRALAAAGALSRELRVRAAADPDPRPRRAALSLADAPAQATLDEGAPLEVLTTIERMMLVRAVPLLAQLGPDDLEILGQRAEEIRFAAGDVLCRAGDREDHVIVLVTGTAEAWVEPDGRRRVLGLVGAGECIGELAALAPAPRSATVTALAPGRALSLRGEDFRALLARRPELAENLLAVLAGRLRAALRAS